MEWKEYKLSQLLIIKNGKDYKSLPNGDIPVFGSGGYMCSVGSCLYEGESILLPRKGTLANIQYYSGAFWTVDTCFYSTINKKLAIPYYLYLYLKKLDLSGLDTGASIPSMTIGTYYALCVKLPSLDYQSKIADIIKNYDTLIDINTKRIKLLEESARELYKEWFVRMRFPGYEKTKFVKGIPEGWKYSSLQDFGRIETGKTPSMEKPEYYGGDYLFIKTPDMHDSMFVLDTTETLSEAGNNCQRNKLLPVNSIMVSCIGSTGIGAVAINAKQGHTNQQINSIILYNQEWLTWLYFTCESLKPTIEMYGATGSTMTNLSKGKFENLKVIEPTVDIIRQFNKLESPLFEEIKNLQLQNQNLAATRDRLLPRLLSGELKVKA